MHFGLLKRIMWVKKKKQEGIDFEENFMVLLVTAYYRARLSIVHPITYVYMDTG
jgi:hypothetical protein